MYKKVLENSSEEIEILVCDLGSQENIAAGGFISPFTHMFFLEKLVVLPEESERKVPLGAFKIGVNGSVMQSILNTVEAGE